MIYQIFKQFFYLFLFLLSSILLIADEIKKPNVLWITGEDMSAKWLGCYGNERIKTPNIDGFAKEGFLYKNCFAQSPVCAPARSGWITGIHPTSLGTVYMRSTYETPDLAWYPDSLRSNGYYTVNFRKTDYNTSTRRTGKGGGPNEGNCGHFIKTWDSYEQYGWRNSDRKSDQPFFVIMNNAGCHEGYLQEGRGKIGDVKPEDMKLAAYHPDIPEMRIDYARYTNGVMKADATFGKVLKELEKDGLSEDTIVIYGSDHGGVLGRSKRFLYDSGTHSSLIVRIPEKFKHLWPAENPGAVMERLVSFIDMPKTWLSMTGSEIPDTMQGNSFLGEQKETPREYVHMARQRMDEVPDMQRAIRDKRYLYIRNYESFRPNGQHLDYLWKAPSMSAWARHHQQGKTDEITGAFFRPKPVEQLFDTLSDPDNVHNLAYDSAHSKTLKRMRNSLKEYILKLHDCGFAPEATLAHRASSNKTTIYEMIRNPQLYDQAAYMEAADLANFATVEDLAKLMELLQSKDEVFRYWGVLGCIQLDQKANTPEIVESMKGLIKSDIEDKASHDARAMAAFFLYRINVDKEAAFQSMAEVLNAKGKPITSLRVWANLRMIGKEGIEIEKAMQGMKLQSTFTKKLEEFKSKMDILL
mgnify:CR=1 FL=1